MNLVPSPKGGIAAACLAVVSVGLNVATEFGLNLTQGQQGAISTLASALIGVLLFFTNHTPGQ